MKNIKQAERTRALSKMNKDRLDYIKSEREKGTTLEVIAKGLGISHQRVSAILKAETGRQ